MKKVVPNKTNDRERERERETEKHRERERERCRDCRLDRDTQKKKHI